MLASNSYILDFGCGSGRDTKYFLEQGFKADAKYKPLDNIGNKDYLQVLAYMFRFDAKKGFYLYPEVMGDDDLILNLNRGTTYEKNVSPREDIVVVKHGLKIPGDAVDYVDFVDKMKFSEQAFISEFA